MGFGENMVSWQKYIDIYITISGVTGVGGGIHGPPYIFCLLFKNIEKVQEHDLYSNQILHHFDLIFFSYIERNACINFQELYAF